jgi:hypothetical protein
MLRVIVCSLGLLAVVSSVTAAPDKKTDKANKSLHATISKIDSQKHSMTVKTIDNGKEQEKNLELSSDVKYVNAAGKEAKSDSFKSGDDVCLMEKDGKVTEVRKEAEAKITKVDQKAGTITVKMTDENGKDVEKTFRLVEESEYLDSNGRVAVLDVFQSGDQILFVEADGRIKSMKKSDHKPSEARAKENASAKTDKK